MNSYVAGYRHTQWGPWSLVVGAIVLGLFFAAALVPSRDGAIIMALVAAVLSVMLVFFSYLNITGESDRLTIAFGPVSVARKSIPYAEMRDVELGKTTFLDGWGIHPSFRGGWVWNIWGFDCVVVRHTGGTTHIGSNDAENLLAFLRTRLREEKV